MTDLRAARGEIGKSLGPIGQAACAKGSFVEVNCGAIPSELVESEFFGHTKGAFTGASEGREGFLEAAHGGTLFLDEIGELPLPAQVKLLRALQEGAVRRIGASKSKNVDFRVIAATNRNLLEEVAAERFREDLFHRLAVGVLRLPPLRERTGDLGALVDDIMDRINCDCAKQPAWVHKKISAGARNLLNQHAWPGNIRELFNTLSRAAIWSPGETIQREDLEQALFPISKGLATNGCSILNRSLGNGFDLPGLLGEVVQHYLWSVLEEAAALTTGPDTVQLESPLNNTSHRPARNVPPARRTRQPKERTPAPMPHNRIAETLAASAPPPANGSASPPPNHNGDRDHRGNFNAILQQAETAKTSLHDAFAQINHLIGSLKRHRRQSKLMQTTLASLTDVSTAESSPFAEMAVLKLLRTLRIQIAAPPEFSRIQLRAEQSCAVVLIGVSIRCVWPIQIHFARKDRYVTEGQYRFQPQDRRTAL